MGKSKECSGRRPKILDAIIFIFIRPRKRGHNRESNDNDRLSSYSTKLVIHNFCLEINCNIIAEAITYQYKY